MTILVLSLFLNIAHATDFVSTFLGFEMPDNFSCKKNTGIYICLNETGPKMKDEIIVVSFKRAGPQDTLEQYNSQMRQPRSIRNKNKTSILSQVISSTNITANAVPWVEARHFNSEIEDYYTTYWVTKVGGVGMLISYSAQKNKKADWLHRSELIRNSLSVDGSAANAIGDASMGEQAGDLENIPGAKATNGSGPNAHTADGQPAKGQHMFSSSGTITVGGVTVKKIHLYLGVAALVLLLFLGFAIKR